MQGGLSPMSVFHLSSFFSNISFFARGLVGLGVLIGAYFTAAGKDC